MSTAAATAEKNLKPYVKHPNGTKDEITFSAKNVTMEDPAKTPVHDVIVALQELLVSLQGEVTTLKNKVAALEDWKPTVSDSLETLDTAVSDNKITKSTVAGWGFLQADSSVLKVFTGATNTKAGTIGMVPQPQKGNGAYATDDENNSKKNTYLGGDGAWHPINLDLYLEKEEAKELYLGIHDKADSAEVSNWAFNIPYSKKGNVWIKDSRDVDDVSPNPPAEGST